MGSCYIKIFWISSGQEWLNPARTFHFLPLHSNDYSGLKNACFTTPYDNPTIISLSTRINQTSNFPGDRSKWWMTRQMQIHFMPIKKLIENINQVNITMVRLLHLKKMIIKVYPDIVTAHLFFSLHPLEISILSQRGTNCNKFILNVGGGGQQSS